jgi:hypothetical protein
MKLFSSFRKDNKGQLMLEAMIAITIAIMGVLGFLSLLSNSVGMSRVVANQYVGNYLAAEGVEVAKNIIDNNVKRGDPWNLGFAAGGCFELDYKTFALGGAVDCGTRTPLRFDATEGVYSYQSGMDSPFSRIITVTPNGGDELRIHSAVNWRARGEFSAIAEDHFFNWRP